jgi:hypothetical protein
MDQMPNSIFQKLPNSKLQPNNNPTQRKWHISITIANVASVNFMLVHHGTQPDDFFISALKLTLLLSLLMSLVYPCLQPRRKRFCWIAITARASKLGFPNAGLFAHTGLENKMVKEKQNSNDH